MSKSRETLSFILLLAAVAVSVPLVLGFLGAAHPALDSFAHFRAHLAVLMGLLALPLLFTSLKREGAMVLLFAILAFGTTLGVTREFLGGSGAAKTEVSGARYSLVQINLRYDNPEPKGVLQMVARERPDVIAYEEAGPEWGKWLGILQGGYPHRLDCHNAATGLSVGILSRRPFAENRQTACAGDGKLAMAPVDFGGSVVTVAAFHSWWPWPGEQAQLIDAISPELQKIQGPRIMAGDFNAVPWSHAVHRMEQASGTRALSGIGGTWMADILPVTLAPYLGLPIDQILVSHEIEAPQVSAREDAGSDHLPVRLDFSVPPPERQDEEEPDTVTL